MNAPVAVKDYWVANVLSFSVDEVQTYWQTLAMHDTLKYRLCNLDDPTWADVVNMIRLHGKFMFNAGCYKTDKIVGDFMLENYTGKAAQIHISLHPENTYKRTLQLSREITDTILNTWTTEDGSPYLETLFGLTPVTNRVACVHALKVGFKKIGILPHGILDRGKNVDAMISIKTRG